MFTVDTAIRFSQQYRCPKTLWDDIWKRALDGYDEYALAGYFMYKTNQRIKAKTIREWLRKTEIYCRANHIMLMGVRVVHSEYFGEYEPYVLKEIVRNMKSSRTQDSRIMV